MAAYSCLIQGHQACIVVHIHVDKARTHKIIFFFLSNHFGYVELLPLPLPLCGSGVLFV